MGNVNVNVNEIVNQVLPIAVQIIFSAVGLWTGMKLTKNKADFLGMLIIAFSCSLIGVLPSPWGLIFSLLCMFLLLWKFAEAKVFPDCIFVVLLSWGIGISGKHLLIYLAKYLTQHMK